MMSKILPSAIDHDFQVKSCRVLNIANGKLHLYFDTYGIQVDAPTDKVFAVGDLVQVGYRGVIGSPIFQKWIVA